MIRFIPPSLDAVLDNAHPEMDAELARVREAACAEGYAAGHARGMAEGEARGRAGCEPELARLRTLADGQAACGAVLRAVDALLDRRTADLRALDDAMRSALAAALRTLFPLLAERGAGAEIAALTAEALRTRATERLVLQTAPATLATVIAEGAVRPDDDRLALVPDDTCAPGTATLSWFGGGLTFDPGALLDRVEAVLAPPSPLPPPTTEDQST